MQSDLVTGRHDNKFKQKGINLGEIHHNTFKLNMSMILYYTFRQDKIPIKDRLIHSKPYNITYYNRHFDGILASFTVYINFVQTLNISERHYNT